MYYSFFSFQVFCTNCAGNADDELILSSPLSVCECVVTCWLPAESARIAIMYKEHTAFHIASFDIIKEKSKYKTNITGRFLQIVAYYFAEEIVATGTCSGWVWGCIYKNSDSL